MLSALGMLLKVGFRGFDLVVVLVWQGHGQGNSGALQVDFKLAAAYLNSNMCKCCSDLGNFTGD